VVGPAIRMCGLLLRVLIVAHVQPADFQMLTVHFPVGTAGFSELISKAVVAIVVIDRNSGRFLSVKFLHRA
jgi:hypothetical protein